MTRSELMPSDSYPELHAEGGVVGFERRIERLEQFSDHWAGYPQWWK